MCLTTYHNQMVPLISLESWLPCALEIKSRSRIHATVAIKMIDRLHDVRMVVQATVHLFMANKLSLQRAYHVITQQRILY